jgi:hypothetical protein
LARKRIGEPLRFAYGPTPVEGLDVARQGFFCIARALLDLSQCISIWICEYVI